VEERGSLTRVPGPIPREITTAHETMDPTPQTQTPITTPTLMGAITIITPAGVRTTTTAKVGQPTLRRLREEEAPAKTLLGMAVATADKGNEGPHS